MAILIVLVVLFIVAVLMVDITLTATTARRSARNASSEFLMDAAIEGRCQVALAQVMYDRRLDEAANKFVDSRNDRMFREEYTTFEAKAADGEEEAEEPAEDGPILVGDTDEVKVTATVTDEEGKFNLYLLAQPDAKKAEAAQDRFAVLLDRFREDTPLDITRTQAEQLRDRVVEHLRRPVPSDGEPGKIPVPRSAPWILLTPDELKVVEGFRDETHNLDAEGILYDARDPEAVREYMADPDNVEPPEDYPGLLRFVTLWSGKAWGDRPGDAVDAPAWDSMAKINVNTAEKPVLETLFPSPQDYLLAQRIVEWRKEAKEGSQAPTDEKAAADEPLPEYQAFEKMDDLKKVDGLEPLLNDGKRFLKDLVAVSSDTYSLDFLAEREKGTRQVRFVVRRGKEGIQTLLREVRADPRFEEKPEEEASAGDE